MKLVRLALLALLVAQATGCAWQRIPEAPQYTESTTIPVRVGIVLGESRPSSTYAPGVIAEWNKMKLFDQIIYPYRQGDAVDLVMRMDIKGGWKGSGGGAGFIVGLTLGLASTVVGPSMTGTHDAQAILYVSSSEIGNYSANVVSTVEWGMAANTSEVATKADTLQTRRMAHELATKIRDDQKAILSKVGK